MQRTARREALEVVAVERAQVDAEAACGVPGVAADHAVAAERGGTETQAAALVVGQRHALGHSGLDAHPTARQERGQAASESVGAATTPEA